jgi:hypothetical protein
MPTMHNPLGTVMSIADRERLVQLAERYDFLIIEDGAYAFLAEPAPKPLFTLAPQRTLYISGLSKSVASGLRWFHRCTESDDAGAGTSHPRVDMEHPVADRRTGLPLDR